MIEIQPSQVTEGIHAFFDPEMPASIRCFAVLNGDISGRIFTDDAVYPSWAAVLESNFGTLYPVGELDAPLLNQIVQDLRRESDILIGYYPDDTDDTIASMLPPDPQYTGFVLEYWKRTGDLQPLMQKLLPGREVRRIDETLFEHPQFAGRDFYIQMFGSKQKALQKGIGFCTMEGLDILAEAFAAPSANGWIEMGVETKEAHRRLGYAALTCAHLIHTCERQGYKTYWNCAKQNADSVALANKLGYTSQKEYQLVAWFKS